MEKKDSEEGDGGAQMVLTYVKSIWAKYYHTHHQLRNWSFYFVGLVLYSHVFEEWANYRCTRLSQCNEKNYLLPLNKGDKLVSPHKAEPDCWINQHLNANMAFGNAIFMAGLHHWIKSVSYVLTPILFLYLWEPVKQKFCSFFPNMTFFPNIAVNSFETNSQRSVVDYIFLHVPFLQSLSQANVILYIYIKHERKIWPFTLTL